MALVVIELGFEDPRLVAAREDFGNEIEALGIQLAEFDLGVDDGYVGFRIEFFILGDEQAYLAVGAPVGTYRSFSKVSRLRQMR